MAKELVILIDETCDECLYVDNICWEATGETTVYACDIAAAAGDDEVTIRHEAIDTFIEKWPPTLEEARKLAQET